MKCGILTGIRRGLSFLLVLSIIVLFHPGQAQAVKYLTLVTGSTGSAIYMLGGGLAKVIEKYIPDVKVAIEGSAGYQDNAVRMATGKADIGTTSPSSTLAVLKKSKKMELFDNIRVLATAHKHSQHIVTLSRSKIYKFSDILGKRVSLGPPGSGTLIRTRTFFKAHGVDIKKDIKPYYLSFTEAGNALQDGSVDVINMTTMYPNPRLLALQTQKKLRFIPMDKEKIRKAIREGAKNPNWMDVIEWPIPANTYKNQPEDVWVPGTIANYCVNKNMSNELAYKITKVMIEHADEVAAIHPAAKMWQLKTAVFARGFPYHPGAVKYYKEKGVWKDRAPGAVAGK